MMVKIVKQKWPEVLATAYQNHIWSGKMALGQHNPVSPRIEP